MAKKTKDLATPVATPATEDPSAMFLLRRGKTYYFRRKVPLAIRQAYGKREYIVSLKTADKTLATALCAPYVIETSRLFAEYLQMVQMDSRNDEGTTSEEAMRVVHYLSDADIQHFCDSFLRRQLADRDRFLEHIQDNPSHRDEAHELFCTEIEEHGPAVIEASAKGIFEAYDHILPVFLAQQKITLADDFPADRLVKLKREFVKANATWLEFKKAIRDGRTVHPPVETRISKPFTVFDAFKKWSSKGNRNKKTEAEMSRLASEFWNHFDGSLHSLDRSTVSAFFDNKKHLTRETLTKQRGLLRAMCAVCVEDETLQANPFADFRIRVGKDSTLKEGFSTSELKAIFSSPEVANDPQMRFLCTLAMITGARIEELCQLSTLDFRNEGSIYYISINREFDKRTKNLNSIRAIPIQKTFVPYIKEYLAGKGNAFDLSKDKYGRKSSAIGKRFNRHVRNRLKLQKTKSFHSFRHGFKTACRDAGIAEEVHDRLTGHASSKTSRKYGDISLMTLHKAISKLKFVSV